MKHHRVVKVTSIAFSKNKVLREHLLDVFPGAKFNDAGKRFSQKELVEYLSDAEAAIVGLDLMNPEVLSALPALNVIAKYGVGLDNVSLDHAKDLKKHVLWTEGVNRRSVSELTLAFMLGLFRNVFSTGYLLKSGVWDKNGGAQLSGKTVGIVGCGHIGEDVLKLLTPFDCKLLINDIVDKSAVCKKYGATSVAFEELIAKSDVVSLHIPLTKKTEGMFHSGVFAKMKRSAFLINTSRGPVISQGDLKKALMDKQIAGAALDVYIEEPPKDLEFLGLKNLMVSPHIGGNSEEAVVAMGMAAIENLSKFYSSTEAR